MSLKPLQHGKRIYSCCNLLQYIGIGNYGIFVSEERLLPEPDAQHPAGINLA